MGKPMLPSPCIPIHETIEGECGKKQNCSNKIEGVLEMEKQKRWFVSRLRVSLVVMLILMALASMIFATNSFAQDAGHPDKVLTAEEAGVQKFGLVAAAIAFGLGAIGAGIAIANVGAAAMGTIGEKPELASQALIFIALAEGLVVFGFITALMILGKV